MNTILVVEDDADIIEILSLYLGGAGFDLLSASNGKQGLELLQGECVDAVLVDIMMPEVNGYEFIKAARSFSDIPIIIVSARNQSADKILGLDVGADGYITKPFEPMEVVSYVKAVLRRSTAAKLATRACRLESEGAALTVGDLVFDNDRMELTKRGSAVPLTAAELKIMLKFMRAPGRIFTKAQLYEAVTGDACLGGEDSIMVHVSNIRAKLGENPADRARVVTVRGLGYRLESH